MSFHGNTRWGGSIRQPDDEQLRALLESLSEADDEHPDVSVVHESGWSISAFRSGLVVLENVETGEGPWYMRDVPSGFTFGLWKLLASGDIQQVRGSQWLPGYGQ